MNTGIQDAYILAWKLALVLGGSPSESLRTAVSISMAVVGTLAARPSF